MARRRGMILASAVLAFFCVWGILAFQTAPASAAAAKTGVGLSEHALKAYREGWKYQYGAYGQYYNGARRTDCSGLIKSYLWWWGDSGDPQPGRIAVAGSSTAMLSSAKQKGSLNLSKASTLPRVQGLILYGPGHVGVYVGGNMEVDNRCTGQNVKYEKVFGGKYKRWQKWFKLPQLSYPTNGFVTLDGKRYYYENGQYVVSATRTVSGVAYTFDSKGAVVAAVAA